MRICLHARKLYHEAKSTSMVRAMPRGLGGSSAFHVGTTRASRTTLGNIHDRTEMEQVSALQRFREFCERSIPFLKFAWESDHGTQKMNGRLCMQAISCVLGCLLHFLYYRRKNHPQYIRSNKCLFDSLLDSSELRERQQRRKGSRAGFPHIQKLPDFECGCEWPCWKNHTPQALQRLYDKFTKLSIHVGSQRKEHQHLLNVMWSPLTNSAENICDIAASALYTVSPWIVAKVRSVIERISKDPTIFEVQPDPHGLNTSKA